MNEISRETGTAHSTTLESYELSLTGVMCFTTSIGDLVSIARRISPSFPVSIRIRDSNNGLGGAKSSLSSDQVIEVIFALLKNTRRTDPRSVTPN